MILPTHVTDREFAGAPTDAHSGPIPEEVFAPV